jgi:hypothetical protein
MIQRSPRFLQGNWALGKRRALEMHPPKKHEHRFTFRWDRKRDIMQLTASGAVAVISAYIFFAAVFILWRYLR